MIISRTPLRISLFGGGSDFPQFYEKHGGAVLTTAIDKYIYVIVKKRFDDKIVLHYSKMEECYSVDEIQHDYIREAMRLYRINDGIEITTMADIPSEGTGLGSSSSLAVGLIYALSEYFYRYFTEDYPNYREWELADRACYLERDILHKPIGLQDQYIAAYGGFQYIAFDAQGVHVTTAHEEKLVNRFSQQRETIQKLEERLLLFYTGITRQASEILQEQIDNLPETSPILINMTTLARRAQKNIEDGQLKLIGDGLNVSWELKRTLASKIDNPLIDYMYYKAIKAGARGGKICGAGGGGFMLLYVEPEKQGDVREALKDYQELPFRFEPEGSKIVYQE